MDGCIESICDQCVSGSTSHYCISNTEHNGPPGDPHIPLIIIKPISDLSSLALLEQRDSYQLLVFYVRKSCILNSLLVTCNAIFSIIQSFFFFFTILQDRKIKVLINMYDDARIYHICVTTLSRCGFGHPSIDPIWSFVHTV